MATDRIDIGNEKLEPLLPVDTSATTGNASATATATSPPQPRPSLWRTGLLLLTSAALGGIAVAIWNRRALERMHQELDATSARGSGTGDIY